MTIIKYHVFAIVLLLVMSGKTFSQLEALEDGEELYYEVNYSFINIGWIKFNADRVMGKPNVFNCKAVMKSNDALPFVTVNYEFLSTMEIKDGTIRPLKFTAYEYKNDKRSVLTYDFNYDSAFVDITKIGYDGAQEINKRIKSSTRFQDGLSVFYYARYAFDKTQTVNVPVIMYVDTAQMKIDFDMKATDASISEIKYDVSSVYLEGFAYFTAVFGLTGDFSGYFSNDAARVPLKAKLQVKIGSISVELKSWKRGNWKAPQF
jgi:hypothetical protein